MTRCARSSRRKAGCGKEQGNDGRVLVMPVRQSLISGLVLVSAASPASHILLLSCFRTHRSPPSIALTHIPPDLLTRSSSVLPYLALFSPRALLALQEEWTGDTH